MRRRGTDGTAVAARRPIGLEIGMILFTAAMMVPVALMLLISVKTNAEAVATPFGIPTTVHWQNYVEAFRSMRYLQTLWNTLFITTISVALGVVLYSMAAYALVRARRGRVVFVFCFSLLAISLAMPPQMTIVPLTLLLRRLGLHGMRVGVALVFVAVNAGFGVFVLHSFVNTVPAAIEESALIDGYGPFAIFWKIMLPLMRAPVVTLIVLVTVRVWNNFIYPLILLQGPESRTLPVAVFYFRGSTIVRWNLLFAGLVLAVVPVVLFYLRMQRLIISGMTHGALKG